MTIKEKVNALIGPAAARKATLIDTLIEMTIEEATNYCNLETYTTKLDNAVVEMVIERYNKVGSEGILNSSASDVKESYINGYSESTINLLNKHRKVKTV